MLLNLPELNQNVIPVTLSQMTHLRSGGIMLHQLAVVLHHSAGKLAWMSFSRSVIPTMPCEMLSNISPTQRTGKCCNLHCTSGKLFHNFLLTQDYQKVVAFSKHLEFSSVHCVAQEEKGGA